MRETEKYLSENVAKPPRRGLPVFALRCALFRIFADDGGKFRAWRLKMQKNKNFFALFLPVWAKRVGTSAGKYDNLKEQRYIRKRNIPAVYTWAVEDM